MCIDVFLTGAVFDIITVKYRWSLRCPTLKSPAFDKSRKGVEDYKRDHFFESFCGHNQLPVSCYGVRKCQPLFMGSERPMCVSVISSVV